MSVLAKRTYKPADERREQILDCALRVFSDRGYHGASIADVCTAAGIGRGTLYQYFDDKVDLLRALAERIERRIEGAVAARRKLVIPEGFVPTEEQAVAFVQARFVEFLKVVFEDAAIARLVLRAGRGADGIVDDTLKRINASVVGLMEADLHASIKAGLARPLDVPFVARFFLGGIEKVVLTALDENRPVDIAAIGREAALLELWGMATFERSEKKKKPKIVSTQKKGTRR